jgi:D-sedoheptulose 7-phosphate isomerase
MTGSKAAQAYAPNVSEGLSQPHAFTNAYRQRLKDAIDTIDLNAVSKAISILAATRDNGKTIFVCGNGGSAATASHFACDMIKGASYGRSRRFRILALTDPFPTISAYSNDVDYECVFVEQLKNLSNSGDTVIGISGSGNSANVIRALEYGNSIGCTTIALTGRDGGRLGPIANVQIRVAEPHMGRIEDSHMIVCHMFGYYFMENGEAGPDKRDLGSRGR